MTLLVLNCGSSSLKAALFDASWRTAAVPRAVWRFLVEGVGGLGRLRSIGNDGSVDEHETDVTDYATAVDRVLQMLDQREPGWRSELVAAGHRVVHGGPRFREAVRVDGQVTSALYALTELAPLHNGPALSALMHLQERLPREVPHVAVFDTAFHRTLSPQAACYAIPFELTERHEVRRYGFHGLAHQDMAEQATRHLDSHGGLRLITLQLGNGCSIAAIRDGHSIDTSMGFTPLEGLVMGTRSGDIDPAVILYLAEREDVTPAEVEQWLNTRSGLLGVSGRSADMRELLRAESEGDTRAGLAIEMFCYRARKYVGAYMAALGGADGIVFGGGIGAHAPAIRARICDGLAWAGLIVDAGRNEADGAPDGLITADASSVRGYAVTVDEEGMIAREVQTLLEARRLRSH